MLYEDCLKLSHTRVSEQQCCMAHIKLARSQSSGLKNGWVTVVATVHSARSSQDAGSFLRVSTCPELTFSFVTFVRDAIAASSFSGAVITWETVPRSSTARTSSQLPRLRVSKRASQVGCCAHWSHGKTTCRHASESMRSRSVTVSTGDVIDELTVYIAGEPVVGYPGVCNHEAPLYRMAVPSPVSTCPVQSFSFVPVQDRLCRLTVRCLFREQFSRNVPAVWGDEVHIFGPSMDTRSSVSLWRC